MKSLPTLINGELYEDEIHRYVPLHATWLTMKNGKTRNFLFRVEVRNERHVDIEFATPVVSGSLSFEIHMAHSHPSKDHLQI